jgi:hypothetical protein
VFQTIWVTSSPHAPSAVAVLTVKLSDGTVFDHMVFLDSEGIGHTTRGLIDEDLDKQRRFRSVGTNSANTTVASVTATKLLDEAALDVVKGTFAAFGPKAYPTELHRYLGFARACTRDESHQTKITCHLLDG